MTKNNYNNHWARNLREYLVDKCQKNYMEAYIQVVEK